MMNPTQVGTPSPSRSRTSGSPTAPVRMPIAVIPTCVVEMTRTGSSISRSAASAPRLPASARDRSAGRRAVTTVYSPITKNALPATSASTARIRRTSSIQPEARDLPDAVRRGRREDHRTLPFPLWSLPKMLNSARTVRDVQTLRPRLSGEVVGPMDAGYDQARQAWNLAADQRPGLVVFPESADDVVAVVEHARRYGLQVVPQGTGHNATPIAWHDDMILLSTSRMRGVEIDVEGRRARVAAGTEWIEVTEVASPHKLAPLAGSSPNVGVDRLLPRRRHQLARPQARPRRQQRPGDRDRHRRRPSAPRRRRQRPGPVLGAARRRRQLRRRHRDGDRPPPHARAVRRRDVVGLGALRRGHARLA